MSLLSSDFLEKTKARARPNPIASTNSHESPLIFRVAIIFKNTLLTDSLLIYQPILQCQDVSFNIGGATGDVRLTILPSDKPCDHDGLVEKDGFGNGVATLKNVNIPAGTSVVVVADDSNGQEVWTNTVRGLALFQLLTHPF